MVEDIYNNKELYNYILRGFFAGEGNLKESLRSSRTIRIAQKERHSLLESILKSLNISFNFRSKDRSYYICGKPNWDIFAKFNLADLNPDKKEKFWKFYGNFKQDHYKHNHLKNTILISINKPQTTRELMKINNRSFARIQDVLIDLKKQGKIKNFRVGSLDYWTNNLDLIIISKIKKEYLDYLDEARKTSEFAKKFKVDFKSSSRRLNELQKLNLVDRDKEKRWRKTSLNKEILII